VLVRLLKPAARVVVPRSSQGGLSVSVPYRLPAPVEREVAVPHNGAIVIAGGLDAHGGSTDGVFRMNAGTGALTSLGTVPQSFHDAAGAIFGNNLFVFGGGVAQANSTVQRFDLATHRGSVADIGQIGGQAPLVDFRQAVVERIDQRLAPLGCGHADSGRHAASSAMCACSTAGFVRTMKTATAAAAKAMNALTSSAACKPLTNCCAATTLDFVGCW